MANAGTISQPIRTIATGCRGLSAIETTNDRIYMGFMGTLVGMNCIVQTYNYAYELQSAIQLDVIGNLFTSMSICLDDKFLIGSHTDGVLSVVNLEAHTSQTMPSIFGEVDNIWDIVLLAKAAPG